MALMESAIRFIYLMAILQLSCATMYKVGDSAGWTTMGNVDYKMWAATKTFHVGDIILFEYNAQFHNVMRITHTEYRACNVSTPLSTYTTGNDSFTVATRGHHYFICGVPGHCQAGQKVDINVLRTSPLAPTPSPPALLPGSPAVSVLGTSPNDAVSLIAMNRFLSKLELALSIFAVFVLSLA